MKKYLIMGTLALIASAIMTGCHVDEDFDSSIVEQKVQTYEKLFVQEFGTIDPDQDWGFGEESALSRTRALQAAITRGNASTNANMWASAGYDVPRELTQGQIDRVVAYFQKNKLEWGGSKDWTEFFVQQVYKGGTKPIGNKETPNGYSAEEYQCANGSWITGGQQMDYLYANMDKSEHINNFNNGNGSPNGSVQNSPGETYLTDNGNGYHTDMIQLMVGSKAENFGYNNSNASKYYWDKYVLIDGDIIDTWATSAAGGNVGESVSGRAFVGFDFEQFYKDEDVYTGSWTYNNKTYKYIVNAPNKYCGHREFFDDSNKPEAVGTIQEWLDNGYLPVYDTAGKEWAKVAKCADGYFSDWIVCIAPGHHGNTPEETTIPIENGSEEKTYTRTTKYYRNTVDDQGRILCEDLGVVSASDIDFNDVVLDVYIYKTTHYVKVETSTDNVNFTVVSNAEDPNISPTYGADIWALAGGGTIPVTIEAGGHTYNLKSNFTPMLSDKTIVNTIVDPEKTYGNSYENFTEAVKLNDELLNIRYIRDIDIYVKYGDNNSGFMKLEAYKGVAPHKLCVPITTLWPRERVEINNAYKAFTMYVKKRDAEGKYITETTNGTTANGQPYYNDTYKRQSTVWQNPASGSVYDNSVNYTPRHMESDWVEMEITDGPTTVESGEIGSGYKSNDPVLIRRRD